MTYLTVARRWQRPLAEVLRAPEGDVQLELAVMSLEAAAAEREDERRRAQEQLQREQAAIDSIRNHRH